MKKTCNLGSYEHLLCIGHGLHNLVAVDGIKRTETIKVIVKKVREIVKALRYRTDEFDKLSKDQTAVAEEMSDLSELFFRDDDEDDEDYYDDEDMDESFEEFGLRDNVNNSTTPGLHRTKTLKLDVKTRWHSVLIMIRSVLAQNRNVVNLMLHKTNHSDLILTSNDVQQLKELVDFLQHFQVITSIFSGDEYATLNFYLVFRSEVRSLLESEPCDSADMKELKVNMLANLENRFPLSDTIVLASLLDPRFQNLLEVKNYLLASKCTAVEFLLNCSSNIFGNSNVSRETVTTVNNDNHLPATGSVKPTYVDDLVERHSTLASVALASSSLVKTVFERECYLLLSMGTKIKVTNVLDFWRDHQKLMPTLAAIAIQVYCIPATSTPSERNFSVAGLIVNSKRSQIHPDNVDKVIFLHNNYDYLKERIFNVNFD